MPASSQVTSAFRVVWSSAALPATVVIPTSRAYSAAVRMAMTSS